MSIEEYGAVHNYQEREVHDEVRRVATERNIVFERDLLADVACVALNRLPPRYIRFDVDFSFYLTDRERAQNAESIRSAVAFAFDYVTQRTRVA